MKKSTVFRLPKIVEQPCKTARVEQMKIRIKYDLFCIRNWSLRLDFKIVVFTTFKGVVVKHVN